MHRAYTSLMPYAFLAVTSELDGEHGRHVTPHDVERPALRPPEPDAVHARRGRARDRRADLELRTVQRVQEFVEAHYPEQISLRHVARELAYSAAYLTDTFRRLTGTAVTAWIIKRRVEAAQQLLREDNMTVACACERVGFNDLCYFTRQFVRLTGTTPGRYRAEVRNTTSSTGGVRKKAK